MLHCSVGISDNHNIMTSEVVTNILTQYYVSKSLKVFIGYEGVKVVIKEVNQIHKIMVIDSMKSYKLTTQEKSTALQYLIFLKKK